MKNSSILIALTLSVVPVLAKANQPLLMSDLEPSQIYSKQEIANQIDSVNKNSNQQFTVLQKEYASLQKINALESHNLNAEDLSFLQTYANYKSQAFVKHDEGSLPIVIFDLASASKHKLSQHYVFNNTNKLKGLYKNNWSQFLQAMTNKDDLDNNIIKQSKLKVLDEIDAKQSLSLAQTLLGERDYNDLIVLKAISNSDNARLTMSLLENNSSPEAQRLMSNGLIKFGINEQETILRKVIESNKILSSNAMANYAKLPAIVQDNEWLKGMLSKDTLGIDAAKAIGVNKNQDALEYANDLVINKQASRTEVVNGLLTLRYANNDYAKTQIRFLLDNNLIKFEDIELEVRRWVD